MFIGKYAIGLFKLLKQMTPRAETLQFDYSDSYCVLKKVNDSKIVEDQCLMVGLTCMFKVMY